MALMSRKITGYQYRGELDVVSSVDRAIGAFLGLACADALSLLLSTEDATIDWRSEPSRLGSAAYPLRWGRVTAANLALTSAVLACQPMQLNDVLTRYQRGYARCLLAEYPWGHESFSSERMSSNEFGGELEPLSSQLLPFALFYRDQPEALDTNLRLCLLLEGVISEEYVFVATQLAEVLRLLLLGTSLADLVVSPQWQSLQQPLAFMEANKTGLIDLPLILSALLKQPNFHDGLCMVAGKALNPRAAMRLYGTLAGAFYGEKFLPLRWTHLLVAGEELRNLAWLLHVGMPAPLVMRAIEALMLHSRSSLSLLNRLVTALPENYQPGLPLNSALGMHLSLPHISHQLRKSLRAVSQCTKRGGGAPQICDLAQSALSEQFEQLQRVFSSYYQWLDWPNVEPTWSFEIVPAGSTAS